MCGTTDYLSPELIRKMGYSYSVDFWALGIILYEFIVGDTPFRSSILKGKVYNVIETREVSKKSI